MNAPLDIDRARKIVLDPSALADEITWAKGHAKAEISDSVEFTSELIPGVSLVVPTYQGRNELPAMLQSLLEQTLDKELFEVIIVGNGEDDGTQAFLEQYSQEHPDLNLRWYYRGLPSAGGARNLGIKLANRKYLTFLDDDDLLQPRFLEASYRQAAENRVVLSPIINVQPDGTEDEFNTLNIRIGALAGQSHPISQNPWVMGFNACKLIPTYIAKLYEYRDDLRSGEDIEYFAHLLLHPELEVFTPSDSDQAAYLRVMTENSVSRQDLTYDFNVSQRLQVISALKDIPVCGAELGARQALERAQSGFIHRYLDEHPEDADKVEDELAARRVTDFEWRQPDAGKAEHLAISYCFPPFADTSAVIAAKAINERRNVVDVISCNMVGVRSRDESIRSLTSRWIDRSAMIDSAPSFAGWEPNCDFAIKALHQAEAWQGDDVYKTLYSRALWMGSHIAAALYKLRHDSVVWTAEFSDPMRTGVEGEPRPGDYVENTTSQKLKKALKSRGFEDIIGESSFDLVEAVTLVLADELIFTNDNQLEYMLSKYDQRTLDVVMAKAKVRPHPQPAPAAYQAVESRYRMPENVINIGYFGAFYVNRGMGDVLTAIMNLPVEYQRLIRLHIFCNKPEELRKEVTELGLGALVYANSYVPYMEFLNLATKFDVLLVNDVTRGAQMKINPFLPSKYSDYAGSGAKIWGLVDPDSPLSKKKLDYRTPAGNAPKMIETLEQIVEEWAEENGQA